MSVWSFELDTIYEAFVDSDGTFARLYFTFDYDYHRVTVHDAYDADWKILPVGSHGSKEVIHSCSHGAWILRVLKDDVQWWYRRRGKLYIPTISEPHEDDPQLREAIHGELKAKEFADIEREIKESVKKKCGIPENYLRGKHYDAVIEDDMPSRSSSPEDVKKAIEWYERQKGNFNTQYTLKPEYTKAYTKAEAKEKRDDMIDAAIYGIPLQTARRHRQGIITNIKEGGNKMHKELYHVILFNRKTETVDFKEYIPAEDALDAGMTASQKYGKYDGKVHLTIIKKIDNSEYEKLERSVVLQ